MSVVRADGDDERERWKKEKKKKKKCRSTCIFDPFCLCFLAGVKKREEASCDLRMRERERERGGGTLTFASFSIVSRRGGTAKLKGLQFAVNSVANSPKESREGRITFISSDLTLLQLF